MRLGISKENYIHENTSVAIIDFDIFFSDIDINNTSALNHEFNQILSNLLDAFPSTEYCIIRLYGGWLLENDLLTSHASELQKTVSNSGLFPFKNPSTGHTIRGKIELAVSLNLLPSYNWGNTCRIRKGLPRYRSDKSSLTEICNSESENCPAKLLDKFTKSRGKQCYVTGCTNINNQVFKITEQKMVDTLMTCDLFDFSGEENVIGILLFSNDTDLLPALVFSKTLSSNNIALVINDNAGTQTQTVLKQHNIQLISI